MESMIGKAPSEEEIKLREISTALQNSLNLLVNFKIVSKVSYRKLQLKLNKTQAKIDKEIEGLRK